MKKQSMPEGSELPTLSFLELYKSHHKLHLNETENVSTSFYITEVVSLLMIIFLLHSNREIKLKNEIKILGVTIDRTLSF